MHPASRAVSSILSNSLPQPCGAAAAWKTRATSPLAPIRGIGGGRLAGGIVHDTQVERAGAPPLPGHLDQPKEFGACKIRAEPKRLEKPRRDLDEGLGVDRLVAPVTAPGRASGGFQNSRSGEVADPGERLQRAEPRLTELLAESCAAPRPPARTRKPIPGSPATRPDSSRPGTSPARRDWRCR